MLSPLISKQHSRRAFSLHHIDGSLTPLRLLFESNRLLFTNGERPESIFPHAIEPFAPTPAITIHNDRKEAIAKHDAQVADNPDELAIYTEGSGINGKIALQQSSLTSKEQSLRT